MLHTQITLFKNIRVAALVATGFLTALAGLFVSPTANMDTTKAVNTLSETSLSMTTANINLVMEVTNPNGTFSASTPAEFTVTTNNYSGYTLSVRAKENNADNSKLLNGSYEFNSISAASSENDFTNGTWGYKPSKINSSANTDFLPAPSYAGDTLDVTATANNNANTYSIALGAKADYSLPNGNYTNTFVITAIANPVGYQITYDANTEDTVTNMPTAQTGDVTATDVTLSSDVPVRAGYDFTSWHDDTANVDYQPGDTIALTQTGANNIILKATWTQTAASGYIINFDANNGTGTMAPQTIPYGESAYLSLNTFTNQGYVFDGWDTVSGGTGTSYADYAVFTAPADSTGGSSITLYAQWKTAVYDTITFDSNDANATGSMANQSIAQGTSAPLTTNAYSNSGYYFNGWNTDQDGLGTGYGDGDSYAAVDTGSSNSVTLYAQWVADTGQGGGSYGKTLQDAYEMAYVTNPGLFPDGNGTKHGLYVPHKTNGVYDGTYFEATQASDYEGIPANDLRFAIQDISLQIYGNGAKVCDYATVIGSSAYVLDLRDYKSYWITKLADGKCWMTQNLDLDLESTATNVATLTSLNTDLNVYGSDGYDSSNNYSQTGNVITWTPDRSTLSSISSWSDDLDTPYSVDPGNIQYDGNSAHNHVGNYYNWSAAIASNDSSSFEYSTFEDASNNPQNSICPAGWRLPVVVDYYTSGQEHNNDFYNIEENYNVSSYTDLINSPLFMTRSGEVTSTGLLGAGNNGYGAYWSSSYDDYDIETAFNFRLQGNYIDSMNEISRASGLPIRCVAR